MIDEPGIAPPVGLFWAAALTATGVVDWRAFGSELETGRFEVYPDLGWGFSDDSKLWFKVRRNRRGLSVARFTVRGDFIQRLRLDPAKQPCVLRIDWIRLRCRVHGQHDPVAFELSSNEDFSALKLRGCHLAGPKLLLVPGNDPWFVIEIERRVGGRVYEVELECAFAALPLARSQAIERRARLREAIRRTAKESRILGAPLRLLRRIARRLTG